MFERKLGEYVPWLRLRDSAIDLRTPTRTGWLLDDAGRATGTVIPPTALAAYRAGLDQPSSISRRASGA